MTADDIRKLADALDPIVALDGKGDDEIELASNALRALADVVDAAKVAQQTILEVAAAQDRGASWYTHGSDGLYRQVAMWVRNGRQALTPALARVETL